MIYPHKYAVKRPGCFEYLASRDETTGITVWTRIGDAQIFDTQREAARMVEQLAAAHIPAMVHPVAAWRKVSRVPR